MQGIFDFFKAVGDFISFFATMITSGVEIITSIFTGIPFVITSTVLAIIGIYAVYTIVGRGGE